MYFNNECFTIRHPQDTKESPMVVFRCYLFYFHYWNFGYQISSLLVYIFIDNLPCEHFPVVNMSQRTRFGKASVASTKSPSKSKAKSRTKKTPMKKVSPTKRHNESTSINLTQPRQKRLSSLTAAALVHYCTSILSPARKATHAKKTSPKNVRLQLNCSKLDFLFHL